MTCAFPMTFRVRGQEAVTRVPCGRCLPCRIARSREWCTRMACELTEWKSAGFVTLTYADEHLPASGTLVPGDSERWLKRLRREVEPRRVRFYLIGDYGEKNGRPHYHAIVYGLDPVRDRGVVDKTWSLGRTNVGTVTEASMRYVADYVTRKVYGEEAVKVYGDRVPPYARMSQGLGRDFCDAHAEQLRESLAITRRGVEVGLPRYFARRLGITLADTWDARLEQARESVEFHRERFPDQKFGITSTGQLAPWFDMPSVGASNKQNEIEARGRAMVRGRRKL